MSSMEQNLEMDKLSYEIFSILESKFLFSDSAPTTPIKSPAHTNGKVCILSIDDDVGGILAAVSLVRLESSLQNISGDPGARIADFFDVAAGSGTGGVLASMLFSSGPDGRPMFTADEALRFVSKNHSSFGLKKKRGIFRRGKGIFRKIFSHSVTLHDTLKPLLIPCYDISTGAPFLFSRADAMETESFNFKIAEICSATCAGRAMQIKSVDGRRSIFAIGGGMATANPTAAAITHVLNNKQEFPLAADVDDLLVISLGSSASNFMGHSGRATPSRAEMLRISGNGMADTVDQALAMAFGHNNMASNYVRIQAIGFLGQNEASGDSKKTMAIAESILKQRNLESVLFKGKKLSKETNAEKLEWFSGELMKERERRKSSPIPTVLLKQAMTLRNSSMTSSTISTTSTGSSASPWSSS